MKQNKILNKITKVTSPSGQTGKSTVAANLALRFAQMGYLTAVVELDRYTGTSPFLHNCTEIHGTKGLQAAMETTEDTEIISNFVQSKQHESLFYLSMHLRNEIHDLHRFNMSQLDLILRVARNKFDKLFIDAPMNYLDNGFFSALHIKPDQTIMVMDENMVTWHRLRQYDLFLKSIKAGYRRTAAVVNQYQELLPPNFATEACEALEMIRIHECCQMPFMKSVVRAGNEGVLLGDTVPSGKKEREYVRALDQMVAFILQADTPEKPEVKKNLQALLPSIFNKRNRTKEKVVNHEA